MRRLLTLCVAFAVVLSACSDGNEVEKAAEEATSDDVVDELEVSNNAGNLDELQRVKEELAEADQRLLILHSASLRGPSDQGCRYEEDRTMAAIDRLDVGLPSAEFRMALDEMRVAASLLATDCRTGAGIGDPQRWFDAARQASLALEELIIDAGG